MSYELIESRRRQGAVVGYVKLGKKRRISLNIGEVSPRSAFLGNERRKANERVLVVVCVGLAIMAVSMMSGCAGQKPGMMRFKDSL